MIHTASARFLRLSLLLIGLVSAGCSGLETKTLTPINLAQECQADDGRNNDIYCLDLEQFGTACTSSQGAIARGDIESWTNPAIAPISGWGDAYDPGSGMYACWEWVSTYSNAYVKFNPNSVVLPGTNQSVNYAVLKWKTHRVQGTPAVSCIKYLYAATEYWHEGMDPGNLLFADLETNAVNGGTYVVTETVNKWFQNPSQNWGFVFVSSRAWTEHNSNSECLDALEELSLTVRYRFDKTQFPSS